MSGGTAPAAEWGGATSAGVGVDGARALAEALNINESLHTLEYTRSGIGWEGGEALGAALGVNSALTSVDLSGNVLGEATRLALATAQQSSRGTLTLLGDVTDTGARAHYSTPLWA